MATPSKTGAQALDDDDRDDDTISVTSTVLSEQKDEAYELECILAERDNDGVMEYLIKWEGYDEERNSWEPHENFEDAQDKTFKEWEEQKMRIARGYAKPFDVAAFEDRCYEWQDVRESRLLRRRNKRIRMGLPVAPLDVEPASEEPEELPIDNEASEPDNDRPTKRRRRSIREKDDSTDESSESSESNNDIWVSKSSKGTTDVAKPSPQWTSKQQSALMSGLELKGPDWAEIRSLHWPFLKEFKNSDLKIQARKVKQEFKDSGRQIPQYLQAVSDGPSSNKNAKSKTLPEKKSRTQSRESTTRKPNSVDRDSSVDSLMEDLKLKTQEQKQYSTSDEEFLAKMKKSIDESTPIVPAPKGKGSRKKSTSAPRGDVAGRKEVKRIESNEPLKADKPKVARAPAPPRGPAIALVSARQTAPGNRPSQGRTGVRPSGNQRPRPGPARASTIGRRPRKPVRAQSSYTPRAPIVGSLLRNWDKGKVHGNSSLAVKDKTRHTDDKVYDKHSIRRRNFLKGRTEPAPDTSSLHFINPKDGKVVKDPVARPGTGTAKTPYQMLQEQKLVESSHAEPPVEETSTMDMTQKPVEPPYTKPAEAESWMDKMDDEVTVNHSSEVLVSPIQTPTAPQAMMMPVQGVKKRTSIPLSAYTQRSQTSAAPPAASPTTPGDPISPHLPPPPPPAQSAGSPPPRPAQPSKAIAPLPAPLVLKTFGDRPEGAVQSPRTAPLPGPSQSNNAVVASHTVSKSPQSTPTSAIFSRQPPLGSSSPTTRMRPPALRQPSNPSGLEKAIADLQQAEREKHAANMSPSGWPNDPVDSNEENDVFGDLYTEQDSGKKILVRFRGFERFYRGLLIKSMPPRSQGLRVTHICTAADYEARFYKRSIHRGTGFIVPTYYSDMAAINRLLETLKLHVSGGLIHLDNVTILLYPANSEEWYFLDGTLPAVPPNVSIRALFRDSMKSIIDAPKEDRDQPLRRKIEKRLAKKGTEIHIPGESNINTIMRVLYEIEYPRLIKSPECAKFFLLFPKERKSEYDLVVKFLGANGALEIYTYNEDETDAAWDYFYQFIEAGAMIVHSSFWEFHTIPNFAKMLRRGPMNVWHLSLKKDKDMLHPHLTRLFPHGCLILLTDSLILLQPLEAVRILAWFRLKILRDKPAGTWKIITRPGLRNFCLNCKDERATDEEGVPFYAIYEQLYYMLEPDELWDLEEDRPKEEAPIYFMTKIKSFNTKVGRRSDYKDLDHAAIAKNDEVLVNFFAGYANWKKEHHRRFHVITGFEDSSPYSKRTEWVEKYTTLEAFTPSVFYTKTKVPSQEELNELAKVRHKEIIAEYDRADAAIDLASKRDDEEAVVTTRNIERMKEKLYELNPAGRAIGEKTTEEMKPFWKAEGERDEAEAKERAKEWEKPWDEWSRDSYSEDDEEEGEDVEMGEGALEDDDLGLGDITDSDESSSDDDD